MIKKFKKIFRIFKSKKIQVSLAISGALLGIFFGYLSIDNPSTLEYLNNSGVNKMSFNAPFTIHFTQRMNKGSVEEVFNIYPKIEGEFNWKNGKTLEFKSKSDLKIGDEYRITLGSSLKNIFGKKIGIDTSLVYEIIGPPEVIFATPGNWNMDENNKQIPIVSSDQIITVMFDRPMEWDDFKVKPLIINPNVDGEFRLLGQSAFQFIPKAWPTNSDFEIKIPSGIMAKSGGLSEKEYKWNIGTSPLFIVETSPKNSDTNIDINQPIIITFNQPVDLNEIKPGNNSLLYPSNDLDAETSPKMDGFFNTEVVYGKDNQGNINKNILVFKPSFPYLYNKEYKFILKSGISGIKNDSESVSSVKSDYEINFITTNKPGVIDFLEPNSDNEKIVLSFYTEMNLDSLIKNIEINPKPISEPKYYISDDKKNIEISCDFEKNIEYNFILKAPLKDLSGNAILDEFKKTFTSGDSKKNLIWTNNNLSIFNTNTYPKFNIESKNIDSLNVDLCKISTDEFISNNEMQSWGDFNCNSSVKKYSIDPKNSINEIDLSKIEEESFDNGIYFISIESGDVKIFKTFQISNTSIVLKKSQENLLLWISDAITKEPISRMELDIFDYSGENIGKGVTDGDGIFKITKSYDEGLYIVGESDEYWGIINEYWQENDNEVQINKDISGEKKAYVLLNKNTFLKDEIIQIKGILRLDYDAQFKLPEDNNVRLTIENSIGEISYEENVITRKNGSFESKFSIPNNILPGNYLIGIYDEGGEKINSNDVNLIISDGKYPFNIGFIDSKSDYFINDEINFNVSGKYSIGLPASSLKGNWELYKKPYYFNQHKNGLYYSFGNFDNILCSKNACKNDLEYVKSGEINLDKNGLSEVELSSKNNKLDYGFEYIFTVKIEDLDGKILSKSANFIIHPSEKYFGLSSKHYLVKNGEDLSISLIAQDIFGNLTSNKKTNLKLINNKDNEVWFDKNYDINLDNQTIKIPTQRKMPSGKYKLIASSEDKNGNVISAELMFYIYNPDELISDKFELLIDQPEYFVGGKVNGILNIPEASEENPISALITYERSGIIKYEVIEAKSKITSISMPIIKEMSPNIFITASYLKNNNINTNSEIDKNENDVKILLLEEEIKKLKDENTDKESIDKLIDKIKELKNNNPINLNSELLSTKANVLIANQDQVINVNVDIEPKNPKPGDEVKLKITTTDFQNRPITSAITISVVEKMTSDFFFKNSPLEYFMNPRAFSSKISSNYFLKNNIFNTSSIIPKLKNISIQNEVKESAYFEPIITTNQSGIAETSFTLPNKNRNWEMQVIATKDSNDFGSNKTIISAKKSLNTEVITPSFIMPGDKTKITANIHNLSDKEVKSNIKISGENIDIKTDTKKGFSINSNEEINIDFIIEVNEEIKNVDEVLINLEINDENIEVKIPVFYSEFIETKGFSKSPKESLLDNIILPKEAIKNSLNINFDLSASFISIAKNLSYLFQIYSYKSSENLSSLIISNFIFDDKENLNKSIENLLKLQNSDGGFLPWINSSESDYWSSAFALFAIDLASEDFDDSEIKVKTYLLSNYENQNLSNKAFALWALSEANEYDTSLSVELFSNREDLNLSGKAFLLMNIINLINAEQKSLSPYLDTLKIELSKEKISDLDFTYFHENTLNSYDNNFRSSAVLLYAYSKLDINNPIIKPLINYIILNSEKTITEKNSQNAIWVILAINELKDITNDSLNIISKLKINGETVLDQSVKSNDFNKIFSYTNKNNTNINFENINKINFTKNGNDDFYLNLLYSYIIKNQYLSWIENKAIITRDYYSIDDYNKEKKLIDFESGNLYRGIINIVVSKDTDNLIVNIPIPAGFKPLSVNELLANETLYLNQKSNSDLLGITLIQNPLWNFNNYLIEDNNINLYAKNLPAGSYEFDYIVQAGIDGEYNNPPAYLKNIIGNDIYSRSSGDIVRID